MKEIRLDISWGTSKYEVPELQPVQEELGNIKTLNETKF